MWRNDRLLEVVTDCAGGNLDSPNSETDSLWEVLCEGGPFHPRGSMGSNQLEDYSERLYETDREQYADRLELTEGYVEQNLDTYLL